MSKQAPRLKEARDAIDKKNYALALECVKDVLEYEEENYNALIFKGIALFNLALQKLKQSSAATPAKATTTAKKTAVAKEDDLDREGASFATAVATYQTAIKVNPKLPLAWQGLSEVYSSLLPASLGPAPVLSRALTELVASAPAKLIEVLKSLLALTPEANVAGRVKLTNRIAEAQLANTEYANALETWKQLLKAVKSLPPNASAKKETPGTFPDDPLAQEIWALAKLCDVLQLEIDIWRREKKAQTAATATGTAPTAAASPAPAASNKPAVVSISAKGSSAKATPAKATATQPKPAPAAATTPSPASLSIEAISAKATELWQTLVTLIGLLEARSPLSQEVFKSKIQLLQHLDSLAKGEIGAVTSKKLILEELVVAVKEVLKHTEGRAFSSHPYQLLIRLYYQGRIPAHLHVSQDYVERVVIMDCYRRFPWLSLVYLHFLEMTRHRWIHDADSRDSTREYLLRLLGRTEGKSLITVKAEAESDSDLKVPALVLLAHIERKANQFSLVNEAAKAGLEAIRKASEAAKVEEGGIYVKYWRSLMNLLGEALHRTRQIDAAQETYQEVLKRIPTDPLALKGLAEVEYEKKHFDKCRELYSTLATARPELSWPTCRIAWLNALQFTHQRTHSPLVSVNGTFLSPELPERDMFKAITSKNTILQAVEAGVQQLALKRMLAIESSDIVVPFDTAMTRHNAPDSKFQSDKQLYESFQDDATLAFGLSYGWYEYWVARIEWALEEFLSAKDWWIKAAKGGAMKSVEAVGSAAESIAKAWLGQYHHREYKLHGRESDLDTAKNCYEAALFQYPTHRMTRYFLLEGEGDGATLLEASLPLLDILLEQAFVQQKKAAPADNKESEEVEDSGEEEEMIGVVDPKAYKRAMLLLQQLSVARHHWALLKLGLCRMRTGQYSLAASSLQNYLRRVPTDVNGQLNLAYVYQKQGKFMAAIRVLAQIDEFQNPQAATSATTPAVGPIIKGGASKATTPPPKPNSGSTEVTSPSTSDPDVFIKAKYLASTVYLKLGQSASAIRDLTAILAVLDSPTADAGQVARLKFIRYMSLLSLGYALFGRCNDEILEGRFLGAKKVLATAGSIAEKLQVAIEKATTDGGKTSTLLDTRMAALAQIRLGAKAYSRAIQIDKESHALYHDLGVNYLWQAQLVKIIVESNSGALSGLNPIEHLLLFDQATQQIEKAIISAPASEAPTRGHATTNLRSKVQLAEYWTLLGIVSSEYQKAVDETKQTLPSTLTRLPGRNFPQRVFTKAIQATGSFTDKSYDYNNADASTDSDPMRVRFSRQMAYTWSSMIAHWMGTGVPAEAIVAAAKAAQNLDPTNPVPWAALGTTSTATSKGDLITELNALEHAVDLDSASADFAILSLARLVYLQSAGASASSLSGGHNAQDVITSLQRRVMVYLLRYVQAHGGGASGKGDKHIASVGNLLGMLQISLRLTRAAGESLRVAAELERPKNASKADKAEELLAKENYGYALELIGDEKEKALALTTEASEGQAKTSLLLHLQMSLCRLDLKLGNKEECLKHLAKVEALLAELRGSADPIDLQMQAKAVRVLSWVAKMARHCAPALAKAKAQLTAKQLDAFTTAVLTAYTAINKSKPEYTETEHRLVLFFGDIAQAHATLASIGILTQDDELAIASMGGVHKCGERLAAGLARVPNHVPLPPDAPMADHQAHSQARTKLLQIRALQIKALSSLQTLQTARTLANASGQQAGVVESRVRRQAMKLAHQAPWLLEPWLKLAGDHANVAEGQKTQIPLPPVTVQVPLHALSVQKQCDFESQSQHFNRALQIDSLRVKTLLAFGKDSAPPVDVEIELEEEAPAAPTGPSILDKELDDDEEIEIVAAKEIVAKIANVELLPPSLQAFRVASRMLHLAPWMSSSWSHLSVAANAVTQHPEIFSASNGTASHWSSVKSNLQTPRVISQSS